MQNDFICILTLNFAILLKTALLGFFSRSVLAHWKSWKVARERTVVKDSVLSYPPEIYLYARINDEPLVLFPSYSRKLPNSTAMCFQIQHCCRTTLHHCSSWNARAKCDDHICKTPNQVVITSYLEQKIQNFPYTTVWNYRGIQRTIW